MKVLKDYSNRDVRLTDERMRHILQHPEMFDMQPEIENTLRDPRIVVRSKVDHRAALYYRYYFGTKVGDKWLCVVVKYLDNDAFVVTAFLTDTLKKGEQIWPRR